MLALFVNSHTSILHPLTTPNYAYYPLCSVFWSTQSWPNFDAMIMCCQILPYPRIFEFLFAFSRSPHAYKSHFTHPHRSVSIYTHFASFCQPTQNIMSGEISPTIWPKTMPCIPAYAHVYLVFLPARTPIPYSTHPHPFTRICTGSYPQLQCIYVLFMLI